MKIHLTFSIVEITYTGPIIVRKEKLDKNNLLTVHIATPEETVSTIDLTALPSFHNYTLHEWKYTLEQFFQKNDITLDAISLRSPYFNMIKNYSSQEASIEGELLFIIESILFSVIKKCSPDFLPPIIFSTIKINGFYSPRFQLKTLPDCLKIKIRPTTDNLNETKKIMHDLLLEKKDIRFRLDGNRSFELEELCFFMNELHHFCGPSFTQSIEYLEEPFKNYYDSFSFFPYSPYAEALDESMLMFLNHLDNLKNYPTSTYFILRPSLMGISKSLAILDLAAQTGHNCVISSSFETSSAMIPLFFLALQNPLTFHGLDTQKFLPPPYNFYSNHN